MKRFAQFWLSRSCGVLALLALLLTLTLGVHGQDFSYATNIDGSITITGYTGAGGNVTIPSAIDGLSVTSIGGWAFFRRTNLTQVTIPATVRQIGSEVFAGSALTNVVLNGLNSIGTGMFSGCQGLTEFIIPDSVTSIEHDAFNYCTNLTKVTIPHSVIAIGSAVFDMTGLTNVTIPRGVTNIDFATFADCHKLKEIYFEGNAPSVATGAFVRVPATVYYLPGTTGWRGTFDGCPTAAWFRLNPIILDSVAQPNRFSFVISWATNTSVIVEASETVNGLWVPLSTNALIGGTSYFNDWTWTKYSQRFYRIRSP